MSNGDEVPIYRGRWITTSAGTQQFVLGQGNPDKAEKQAERSKQMSIELIHGDNFPQKLIHKRIRYNGGKLYWRTKEEVHFMDAFWNSRYAGKEAGTIGGKCKNTCIISINNNRTSRAIMTWIYFFKNLPKNMVVTHKDGNTLNDDIDNLVLAPSLADRYIIPTRKPNDKYAVKTSGVTFRKGGKAKPYEARICYKGKRYACGAWATEKEAASSVMNKRIELQNKGASNE